MCIDNWSSQISPAKHMVDLHLSGDTAQCCSAKMQDMSGTEVTYQKAFAAGQDAGTSRERVTQC